MQFTTIKRDERESVIDFNIRFQREWKKIPQATKPSPEVALVYYLRAFHLDLSLQIINKGSRTFPEIYRDAIVAKIDLIASAKLPMRAPRLLIVQPILHYPSQKPYPADQAPPLAPILYAIHPPYVPPRTPILTTPRPPLMLPALDIPLALPTPS